MARLVSRPIVVSCGRRDNEATEKEKKGKGRETGRSVNGTRQDQLEFIVLVPRTRSTILLIVKRLNYSF